MNPGFTSMRAEAIKDGLTQEDVDRIDALREQEMLALMPGQLVMACKYCGGPDHAIGLCHAVSAVNYRSDGTVERIEFDRSPSFMAARIDWLDVRAGLQGAHSLHRSAAGPSRG